MTLLSVVAGCAPPIPQVDHVSIAPSAPDQRWRPPRAVEAADSVRAGVAPRELLARRTPLTLTEIVSLALRSNPNTRASWAQATMYANAFGAARGAYFPSVDGAVSETRSRQPTSAGSTTSGSAGTRTTFAPSVSLTYSVLDFGGRAGTVANARETAYALSFTHNATLQSAVLNVEQAYYAYVGARAVLEAAQLSLREAEASSRAAWKKDSLGMATRADVLQSRTALAQARLSLDTANAAVQTTRTSLAVAFGAPAVLQFDVEDCLDTINVGAVTQSIESLVDDALRRRPDLQAAQAYVRAAQADVRAARGALFPSVSLSATTGYTDANVHSLTGHNYSVLLGLSVPVFHGLSSRYDVARARAGVEYERAYADALQQSVSGNVVIAYHQVQSATEIVGTSDDLLASAAETMLVTRARYTAGLDNIINLLAAQTNLAVARAQRARARSSWAYQLAALAYAAGTLDERGQSGISTAALPPR